MDMSKLEPNAQLYPYTHAHEFVCFAGLDGFVAVVAKVGTAIWHVAKLESIMAVLPKLSRTISIVADLDGFVAVVAKLVSCMANLSVRFHGDSIQT